MLGTHQVVTTVLLSLHRTDVSLYRREIDNVLTHYKIAVSIDIILSGQQTTKALIRLF